jgi:hypothetical protein
MLLSPLKERLVGLILNQSGADNDDCGITVVWAEWAVVWAARMVSAVSAVSESADVTAVEVLI